MYSDGTFCLRPHPMFILTINAHSLIPRPLPAFNVTREKQEGLVSEVMWGGTVIIVCGCTISVVCSAVHRSKPLNTLGIAAMKVLSSRSTCELLMMYGS